MSSFRPRHRPSVPSVRLPALLSAACVVCVASGGYATFRYCSDATRLPVGVLTVSASTVLYILALIATDMFPARHASMRFSDYVRRHRSTSASVAPTAEDRAHAGLQRYQVGCRDLDGHFDNAPQTFGRLFYPMEEAIDDSNAVVPAVPQNDWRYIAGMLRHARLPRIAGYHLADAKLHATLNGPVAESVRQAHETALDDGGLVGKREHPIVVVSHDIGGHRNAYFSFVADLVALGAFVVCIEHADTTAAHAAPSVAAAGSVDAMEVPFCHVDATKVGMAEDTVTRHRQLMDERVPQLRAVVAELATGALHRLLGLTVPAWAVPVALFGHGFGATTVAATALAHAQEDEVQHISGVVALDLWHVPGAHLPIMAQAVGSRVAPAFFLDTEERFRHVTSRKLREDVTRMWGRPHGSGRGNQTKSVHLPATPSSKATGTWHQGSDHATLSELSLQIRLPLWRPRYKIADDRRQMALWASQFFSKVQEFTVVAPTRSASSAALS